MHLMWLWLSLVTDVPLTDRLALLRLAGGPSALYDADRDMLTALCRKEAHVAALSDKSLNRALAVSKKCEKLGIRVIPLDAPDYPESLKNISDPPLVLYCKGTLPDCREIPMVGMVGTRRASGYGMSVARNLGSQLGAQGGCVVSGMADGIDAAATQGALLVDAPAIGVLGCGLDVVFPKSNLPLFQKMEQQGCLLSEYPPETPPIGWQFLQRNRIISGLSLAVVVVEAPVRSGALNTARHARNQGRALYAVPGPLGQGSCAGSNKLLQGEASLLTCGWDILKNYQEQYPNQIRKAEVKLPPEEKQSSAQPEKKTAAPEVPSSPEKTPAPAPDALSDEERKIFEALGTEELQINTITERTGLSAAAVMSALTFMELRGYIVTMPGGWAKIAENQ